MSILKEGRVGDRSLTLTHSPERRQTVVEAAHREGGLRFVPESLRPVIENFERLFVNRWELYARQLCDGSYRCMRNPLSYQLLWQHLRGQLTLGVYSLDEDDRAKWLAFDADDDKEWADLLALSSRLEDENASSYLERSRRGGHLWLFFEEPLSGRTVRAFGKALLSWEKTTMEMFPKREKNSGGPGCLIRLPLGVHRRDGKRYPFVDRHGVLIGQTVQDQLNALLNVQVVSGAFVAEVLGGVFAEDRNPAPQGVVKQSPEGETIGLIDHLKQIDLVQFIGTHVELTPSGKAHCPFHDDQHMSFSVNREGNYWNCFAGCGGGDIIHFWEKWRKISRREAIAELARLSDLLDG